MGAFIQFPNDIRAAHARATLINLMLGFRDADYPTRYVRSRDDTVERAIFFNGSATAPAAYSFQGPNGIHVFVGGLESRAQAEAVWDGYTGPKGFISELGENEWFRAAALEITTQVLSLYAPRQNLYLSGYSAGAGVCWHIPQYFDPINTVESRKWFTALNSPCPSTFRADFHPPIEQRCHWFCSDDPITLVPPSPTTFQAFAANLSLRQIRRISAYRQWRNGLAVSQTANITPSWAATDLPGDAVTTIQRWIATAEAGVQTPHSLPVLVSRLELAMSRLAPNRQVVPSPVTPTPGHTLTVREADGVITNVVQTAFNDASRQNAVPVSIPRERLFYAAREGRIWYVWFGNVKVALAPFKRRARGLANDGNRFIRRLQNEAVVNAEVLAQQWVAYLAAASTPDSGFTPQLNTRLGGTNP